MAERLTEYFECGAYTEKQNIVDVSDKVKFFDNGCVMGKVIDKLSIVEDIMEKYGVDIQNLDYILEDYSKNQGRDFAICEERDTLRQERDTWQKACELACEREDDCYVYDNIHRAYEFYQQAKQFAGR